MTKVKLDHIGIKVIMDDTNMVQQINFVKKEMYKLPPPPGKKAANEQFTSPSYFHWGINSITPLCKLHIKNYGSEDIMYKINPRDTSDLEVVYELPDVEERLIDFVTVPCIESINLKIMGPGSTTVRLEGFILYNA